MALPKPKDFGATKKTVDELNSELQELRLKKLATDDVVEFYITEIFSFLLILMTVLVISLFYLDNPDAFKKSIIESFWSDGVFSFIAIFFISFVLAVIILSPLLHPILGSRIDIFYVKIRSIDITDLEKEISKVEKAITKRKRFDDAYYAHNINERKQEYLEKEMDSYSGNDNEKEMDSFLLFHNERMKEFVGKGCDLESIQKLDTFEWYSFVTHLLSYFGATEDSGEFGGNPFDDILAFPEIQLGNFNSTETITLKVLGSKGSPVTISDLKVLPGIFQFEEKVVILTQEKLNKACQDFLKDTNIQVLSAADITEWAKVSDNYDEYLKLFGFEIGGAASGPDLNESTN